jgi:hypothetical protein
LVLSGGWVVIRFHGLGNIESAFVPILYIEGQLIDDLFQFFLCLKLSFKVAFLVYSELGILIRHVEVLVSSLPGGGGLRLRVKLLGF